MLRINNGEEPFKLWARVQVSNQLKILVPVGRPINIVTAVKKDRVSASIPTVNIWCAQTKKPRTNKLMTASNIEVLPNRGDAQLFCIAKEIATLIGVARQITSAEPSKKFLKYLKLLL